MRRQVILGATATAVLGGLAGVALAAGSTQRTPAYCSIPAGPANPSWAFHVGAPIQGASGTYAHGHGTVTGNRATGEMCQVNRAAGSDRQVILSVTAGTVSSQHGVTVDGAKGNGLAVHVRVASSNDARCLAGTKGTVTLFASFSGPRRDIVQLAFAKSCRDHEHDYTGSQVVVLVPR